MNSYPINKDFKKYADFRPSISRASLPLINGLMLLYKPDFPNSNTKITKIRISAGGGVIIPTYLFEPAGLGANAPCLVYYHGGGFVMGAAPQHYKLCLEYAEKTPCKLLFVNYRLAPQHPFPIPVDDCCTAFFWMAESAGRFGIDPKRIAVGGDSAGGNLAAATALLARDGGSAQPCFQMLIYPVIDRRMQTESMKRFSDTPMWNSVLNAKMWKWYLEGAGSANIEYASPIEADSLVGLPEAYVETAEFDCLHDEGAAYAAALNSAGCLTRLNETSGTMHGFDIVSGSTIVRDSVYARVESLRQAFGIRRE